MKNIYLNQKDKEISDLIEAESQRQNNSLELIASENVASRAVREAQGSILTNKYAEGYPGKRYYGGCVYVDQIENLAIERVKKLFNCKYANVQPHSGSQANQAVFLALAKPGDTILGMGLESGGHLTHGANPNLSGKWFNAVKYGVNKEDNLINYEEVESLASIHRPKIIIAGGSAYPRKIDFSRFREISDKVGAYLLCDIAHYSGLVATGHYPSPMEHAHVVTSTTHKTLRGPRGGIILTNDDAIIKKIDSAIFPGLQGGPLMHVIAAKAVCFKEALSEDFKEYSGNIIKNARILAETLKNHGFKLATDGTDSHLILMDLREKNITGKLAEELLEKHHIICNKNAVAFDTKSPFITSGIRLGTPACTSRGFKENEFEIVGDMIAEILSKINEKADFSTDEQIIDKVKYLCKKFPINYD